MQSSIKLNIRLWLLLSVLKVCLTCNTFGNLSVEIHPRNGNPFNTRIVGCIEPSRFSDNPELEVAEVKFHGQPIKLLKKGTVQNLARLKYVVFNDTDTETVEPEAFRHLPRLQGLFLIHSRVEIIHNNVFQNLPALNKLRLHHNEIRVIEDYAFANIISLKYIFLGNNKLEQLNPTWFINSTSLQELDFQKNCISKIPTQAFPGLSNLSKITLDYNKISEIEDGAFDDIENLEYLSLRHNCLKLMPVGIFSSKINIRALFIDSNIFNFIGNEVLEKISVKEISLSGNPWKCPCLQRTLFWFYQKHGTSKLCSSCSVEQTIEPVCIYPNLFSSTCLDIIDDEATKTYFNLSSNTNIVSKCTVADTK